VCCNPAMNLPHRPSILHRPQRAQPSKANEETYESQYQKEQAILRAKQEKQQDTRDRLLRSLHPQREDKAAAWEELVASNSLLASRHNRADRPEQPSNPASTASAMPDGTRPWHHAMATQQFTEAAEDAARRRFAAEVAAENQRLAREKELKRAMDEQAKRQQPVQDTWYNRGDTHMRAEAHYGSTGASALSSAAACPQRPSTAYPWATTNAGLAAPSSAAANPQRSSTSYPWATADAEVVVRPQTAQPAQKLPERQYPWSWQS
ncbi:hypothetical protein Agub_g575, partial [Astrephomene gubernaculifera]